MRRMLDPKELGGGGGIQLYRHHIQVKGGSSRNEVSFELYTKSDTEFTKESLIEYINNKKIQCSGRILRNEKFYNAEFIYVNNESLTCQWYDLASIEADTALFGYFTITDDVYQV